MGHPPEDDWKHDPAQTPEAALEGGDQADADETDELKFRFRGREYTITIPDLLDTAFDEQAVLERAVGQPFSDAFNFAFSRTQQWAMWIALRRAGQKVTFDALGSVKPSDIEVEGPTEPDTDGE